MRPQADEVEFLYEIMSVTGEATVMMMICLNYLKSIEVIEMEPIPPLAILLCSLLIVAGNLGAQVSLLSISFRSPTVAGFCSPCVQLQAIVLRRILATAEPLHDKLIQRSEFYRHCTEALMQRWIRSFRSIPPFLVVNFVDSLVISCRAQKWRFSSFCFDMPCRAFWILLRCLHSRFRLFTSLKLRP